MGKKLVVVESPAKVKTVGKILGSDFVVCSSMGHIRDLPVKGLGVDIENGFAPKYEVVKGRKKIVEELRKAAVGCDTVYLAPDPDREGEAIAWHLREILEKGAKDLVFHRVQYNEITARAVRRAFDEPVEIDMSRVHAQQARRILDRIVGYMVSPMLWRRLKRGLSAGRVQSVALRLVCEREQEIEKFVPEAFWIMGAVVRKKVVPLDPFRIRLVKVGGEKADIKSAEAAEAIAADLEGRALKVADVRTKTVTRHPSPPHITSTLQQAGSSYCSYSPQRTMSIAQKLYEGIDLGDGPVGLITYMRTDSFAVAQDALTASRAFITEKFGADYCPEKPNYFRSRASAQEAHEAIRPTDATRTPESLKGYLDAAEMNIYRLVWQRFMASQMTDAKIRQRTVEVAAVASAEDAKPYVFHATCSEIEFPGYMRVTGAESRRKEKDEETQTLPELTPGELLECLEWLSERKETKPPPRYSEASLVRAMEDNGVGRPSTYAQTMTTLRNRRYVAMKNRLLHPTILGRDVSSLLVETLGELFDVKFTASMEDSLDEVEKGVLPWDGMLRTFYDRFEKWMEQTKTPPADEAAVRRVLDMFHVVETWAPEEKRGKRTFSDSKFVESVKKQLADKERAVSVRQLDALLRIGWRYREQIPEIETVIGECGRAEILKTRRFSRPKNRRGENF